MFSANRDKLRKTFTEAWRKAKADEPLEGLEQQIVGVIRQHPEYRSLLDSGAAAIGREWLPEDGETNPFLHMSLHLALLDQITTDQPAGIRKLYRRMVQSCLGNLHEAEHRMLDCLAEEIWKTQHQQHEFNPKTYLKCIKRRGGGSRNSG